ncbi:NRAMP family, partial [Dichotomocladium elegans]
MKGVRLLGRATSYLFQLLRFIGPGFMVAVGYFDPGNWATNLEGGSEFGYRLLFIVLFSNMIAVFLQNMTIRLGTVTGLDLASCSRRYFHRYLNLFLYVLAEIAIITTDMAEVIGSAIALTLLIPALPLPASVAITVVDVFIILMFYKDDPDTADTSSMRVIRYFEIFVMLLVAAVGICITIILAYSDTVAVDVLKGYIPSRAIFTDTECLYVAIGIIGATVMPHNLYLHSFIVQSRTWGWRKKRPIVVEDEPDHWVIQDFSRNMVTSPEKNPDTPPVIIDTEAETRRMDEDALRSYLKKQVGNNLHYGLVDLVVALLFAFYVNSAILTVAGANFFYTPNQVSVNDLFGASQLLSDYLGPAAGKVFALALLGSGQSSTITATLSGQ